MKNIKKVIRLMYKCNHEISLKTKYKKKKNKKNKKNNITEMK